MFMFEPSETQILNKQAGRQISSLAAKL